MIRRWIQRACLLAVFCCLLTPRVDAAVVGVTWDAGTVGNGTTEAVTRSVTAGNTLLVVASIDGNVGGNTTLTFSTTSGTTSGWTEVTSIDTYDAGDAFGIEAAYATATNTESVTVTVTTGATTAGRWILLVEMNNVPGGFDAAAYADTTATGGTAGLTNAVAAATRVVLGIWWGGGTGGVNTGYTDGATGWNYGGNFARVQYLTETSATSRTGAFTAGGTAPLHLFQFIFSDSGGGGGGSALPKIIQQMGQ